MAKICKNKNPLVRSGTSQLQRNLAALQKEYVQIDEHTTADLLLFAKKFAEHLKYYNTDNQANGDWEDFFTGDVSIMIALIADTDLEQFDHVFQDLVEQLKIELSGLSSTPSPDSSSDLPSFKKLFDFILTIAAHLDWQVNQLGNESGLKGFAKATIQQQCTKAFKNLLGFYKVAEEGNFISATTHFKLVDNVIFTPFQLIPNLYQKYTQDIIANGLSHFWLNDTDSWASIYTSLDRLDYQYAYGKSETATVSTQTDVKQHIEPFLDTINGIWQHLLTAYQKIAFEAPRFLEETLENWPHHQPHIALYLGFSKLFRFAQNHLNGLKERHLAFYYKDVLRLKEKPAIPDQVHLMMTLAKQAESYLLEKETAFKAGRDNIRQPVHYVANEDTILNKIKVAIFQAIYHTVSDGKIYSALKADSADGIEAAITTNDGQWSAFGPAMNYRGPITGTNSEIPQAPSGDEAAVELYQQVTSFREIGFAVASPNWYLKGGTRTIYIALNTANNTVSFDNVNWGNGSFSILLTGSKGWIHPESLVSHQLNDNSLLIRCILTADFEEIVPYNLKVHGETFNTRHPIIKVLLNEDATNDYLKLKNLEIIKITTSVKVEGLKDLLLQNDLGRLDISQPILPFGAIPEVGNSLIIGNKEAFQKELKELDIQLTWQGLNDTSNSFKPSTDISVRLDYLKNNTWEVGDNKQFLTIYRPVYRDSVGDKAATNFLARNNIRGVISSELQAELTTEVFNASVQQTAGVKYLLSASLGGVSLISEEKYQASIGQSSLKHFDYSRETPYTSNSKNGKIRLRLNNNFGHKTYQREYPKALIERSGITGLTVDAQFSNGLKDPPYTPKFSEIALNYTATSTFNFTTNEADFNNRAEQFFHIHPFGQREEHPFLNRDGQTITAFPRLDNEGELYIGLEHVKPQQSVILLFKLAEGSANPLKQQQAIKWAYLYQNKWIDFDSTDKAEYADNTNGLLQTGTIRFFFPKKINADNTWLANGKTWLRCSVAQHSDAICKIIAIHAQVITATFVDQENAEDFLAKPLPATTIAKTVISEAALKKIEQPYNSFGGQVKEAQPVFFKRISERLRHKDKAITIWDYEHLILEAFPEIFKVKCLNHTHIIADSDDANQKMINEVAPGHVLIVPVPDLKNQNAIDPIRPYTSLSTLSLIQQFLEKRISPCVQLSVVNPLFESIKVSFEVAFREGKEFTFHAKLLNEDIIRFLAPWAFDTNKGNEIAFGGRVYKSVILDYIEELPYVDFLTNFIMDQYTGTDVSDSFDIEEARASSVRSILVAHEQHSIKPMTSCK